MNRHFKPLQAITTFRQQLRCTHDDDVAFFLKRKRKKQEEEKKEASETFECSATPRKSNDRSYDREKSITSALRAMIVPPITSTPTYDDHIDDTIESLKIVFKATDDSLATKHVGSYYMRHFKKESLNFN